MADESIHEEGGIIDRIKESPRTVSAVIIILIVAAAIYAFSADETTNTTNTGAANEQATEEAATGISPEASSGEVAAMNEEGEEGRGEPAEALPEPERTNEGFVEVAQPGEGVTHLARRATTQWLIENQPNYTVTDEHRIYIEDYIQNRIGSMPLTLGEKQTITYDMIDEAVAAAGELNESQLENLSQYTHVFQ